MIVCYICGLVYRPSKEDDVFYFNWFVSACVLTQAAEFESAPGFGDAQTAVAPLKIFYASWGNFVTKRTFSWKVFQLVIFQMPYLN